MLNEPVAAPGTVGQNFALSVQDAPFAKVCGSWHVPIPPKVKPVPRTLESISVSGELPVLVTVEASGALQLPKGTTPRFSVAGLSVIPGEPPTPVRGS